MTFQKDVHVFRAIAIMFIVGGHTRLLFNWDADGNLGRLLADFLANGTILFVFVSGYLFQALSKKYVYSTYLKSKLRNVVLPYIIVSTPAVLLAIYYYGLADKFPEVADHGALYQALWLYVKGGAHINFPLWFIPMISLFFLFAPLFRLFIRYPMLYILLLPLVVVSMFVHRAPMPHLNTLHLAVYFLSAYIAGMCVSQYRDNVNGIISGRLAPLLVVYVSVVLMHYAFATKHGVHAAESWFTTEEGVFDWPFLQKMILCFVLLELGRKYEATLYPKLKYIADVSFGIYFVHAYFLKAIAVLTPDNWLNGSMYRFIVAFVFVMLCCIGSCYLMQKIFGRHSRKLIGC